MSEDACAGSGGSALVDHAAWAPLDIDPVAALETPPPAPLPCDPTAVVIENDALEIHTGGCPYARLGQPARRGGNAGDGLRVLLWHQPLTLPPGETGPAEGHLAIAIDGAVVWQRTVAIPAKGQSYSDLVPLQAGFCAGANISVHVHNHGANAWTIQTLAIEPAP